MIALRQLYEIQEIDTEIDQKNRSLENIKSQLGEGEEIIKARLSLELSLKLFKDFEIQQHSYEKEVDDINSKIAIEEKKLYKGTGKNPKELMDLQKEIELIKERRRSKEDELLTIMEKADITQHDVNQKTRELAEIENSWKAKQHQLSVEQRELESAINKLKETKTASAAGIEQKIMQLYEDLRLKKNGRAVAKVEQGRCMGCRMSLPISDQQKARAGQELSMCSNCGRILCII